jgi:hypothetical protein
MSTCNLSWSSDAVESIVDAEELDLDIGGSKPSLVRSVVMSGPGGL